jgi:ATP-dependent Clp protease adaptor protein ClpS
MTFTEDSASTVVLPKPKKKKKSRAKANEQSKLQPRFNVILWDDQEHTFPYVIRMMQTLFRKSEEEAKQIADQVNTTGRAICMTTSKEVAELKRDQIHAFGSDPLASRGKNAGSMWASIEPAPGS